MAGEAGEVANKVKKIIRDGTENLPEDWKDQLASEIGDVLWYCAALSNDIGIPLALIAAQNRDKLLELVNRKAPIKVVAEINDRHKREGAINCPLFYYALFC